MTEQEADIVLIAIETAYTTAFLDGFATGWDLAANKVLPNQEGAIEQAKKAANDYVSVMKIRILNNLSQNRKN